MTANKDTELLKEYIQEAVLSEYIYTQPGRAGAALRGAFRGAWEKSFGDAGGGAEALKGKLKKTGAAVKSLAKTALAGAADVLTLGALEANYDKIHGQYLEDLKDIEKKHGGAMRRLDNAFKKNLSAVEVAGFFANPAAMVAAYYGDKATKKLVQKAEQFALKSGASEDFKKKVDSYYAQLNNEVEKARQASRGKLKSDEKKTIANNLKNLKGKIESETNKLRGLGKTNPLYTQGTDLISNINDVLDTIE